MFPILFLFFEAQIHRSLFGLAAVILAVAGLVHAISTGSAYPAGLEDEFFAVDDVKVWIR
jgi:hypothetical protein